MRNIDSITLLKMTPAILVALGALVVSVTPKNTQIPKENTCKYAIQAIKVPRMDAESPIPFSFEIDKKRKILKGPKIPSKNKFNRQSDYKPLAWKNYRKYGFYGARMR